jgi:hypothetical protein
MARQVNTELDFKRPILLDGDPGTPGQSIQSAGGDAPPVWANGSPASAVGLPLFVQSTAPTVGELGGFTSYAWLDTSNPGSPSLVFEDGT